MSHTLTLSTLAVLALVASTASAQATATPSKPAATTQAKPMAPAPARATTTPAAAHEKLDLNTATRDQLAALPGVGATYADAIIKNRPYTSESQLVQKKVFSEAQFKKIHRLVMAQHTEKKS